MYLGTIKLESNLTFYANTHTPSTGAAVDADAAPEYRVYEDETATPLLTGTMALLDDANTTGYYSEQIAVTAANGFEVGKSYCIRITGVVATVTGVELHTFAVDTSRVSDVATTIGVAGAGLTALGDTRLANLDATVSSRSTLTGANVTAAVPTAAAVADAVWDEATAGHATAGSTGKALSDAGAAGDPWSAAVRTLTSSAAATAATVAGTTITCTRGDTWSISLTGLGNIAARTKLWFTVKSGYSVADTESLVQIVETTGLTYINKAVATTAANGSITVTDAATGALTIALAAAESAKLSVASNLIYDIQMLTATGVTTLTSGTFVVSSDVTRATS